MSEYPQGAGSQGIEFVLAVLRAFDGQKALQPICRDIVAALQPDNELLNEVAIVLDTTGMVSGQFGFVEAYRGKKAEMADWLSDPREPVRAFAERHIRSLERQIAADQRRSMEEHELRKREYEPMGEEYADAAEATERSAPPKPYSPPARPSHTHRQSAAPADAARHPPR
jgi:hypothetical protein